MTQHYNILLCQYTAMLTGAPELACASVVCIICALKEWTVKHIHTCVLCFSSGPWGDDFQLHEDAGTLYYCTPHWEDGQKLTMFPLRLSDTIHRDQVVLLHP